MSDNALYNLTPLASLLLVGLLLALGPLAWVYWRNRDKTPLQQVQVLRLLTLFLTFDLVLFGAFTRLTDSGLGCPDWPGCYGHTSPIGANQAIAAAQLAMPTGPVTHAKAWIEMTHRYLATGVGALILAMAVISWRNWRNAVAIQVGPRAAVDPPWLATLTLIWVCVQGTFGALTVTLKLYPAIVTMHLAGALALLVLLCLQVVQGSGTSRNQVLPGSLHRWLWLAAALLAWQIVLGGWVSANYAVLACSDFPLCQNRWWPDMNFSQGFELWRHLGVTAAGEPISFAALTAIHYTHRLMAYGVLALLVALAWQLNRHGAWRNHSRVLAALVGLQFASGLGNVVLGWPLLAALLHTAGAAAMVLTLTWVLASARSASPRRLVSRQNLTDAVAAQGIHPERPA
jgi:cytochrome c oxidase assembly protein subunit 15